MVMKVFECAICKEFFFNKVKGETRFFGTRKDVRKHLREIHHSNRRAGRPEHKGNRKLGGKDNRSIITKNCIVYKEF